MEILSLPLILGLETSILVFLFSFFFFLFSFFFFLFSFFFFLFSFFFFLFSFFFFLFSFFLFSFLSPSSTPTNPHPFYPPNKTQLSPPKKDYINSLKDHITTQQHKETIEYIQKRHQYIVIDYPNRLFNSIFLLFVSLVAASLFLFRAFLFYPSSPDDFDSDGGGYEIALISCYIMVFFFVFILGTSFIRLWRLVTLVWEPELGCCDRERRKERVREDVEQWSLEQFGAR